MLFTAVSNFTPHFAINKEQLMYISRQKYLAESGVGSKLCVPNFTGGKTNRPTQMEKKKKEKKLF